MPVRGEFELGGTKPNECRPPDGCLLKGNCALKDDPTAIYHRGPQKRPAKIANWMSVQSCSNRMKGKCPNETKNKLQKRWISKTGIGQKWWRKTERGRKTRKIKIEFASNRSLPFQTDITEKTGKNRWNDSKLKRKPQKKEANRKISEES